MAPIDESTDAEYVALRCAAERNGMTMRQALTAALSAFVFFDNAVRDGGQLRISYGIDGWDAVDWPRLISDAKTG